jgi:hypothetical protein
VCVGNEIVIVRCEGENIAKCHPAEGVETTTDIILVGRFQGRYGGIIETVRTLVYGSFSCIFS